MFLGTEAGLQMRRLADNKMFTALKFGFQVLPVTPGSDEQDSIKTESQGFLLSFWPRSRAVVAVTCLQGTFHL